MNFKSKIFILPGLNNSGEGHWQTLWERQFGFGRIQQRDWDTPDCNEWIDQIDNELSNYDLKNIILVGHSLACSTIGYWSKKYGRAIKGALMVAPSDTESPVYPAGTTGFSPMPLWRLPFPSFVVTSDNDIYVSTARAEQFASSWGSKLVTLHNAGHINLASGFGMWPDGLNILKELDQ